MRNPARRIEVDDELAVEVIAVDVIAVDVIDELEVRDELDEVRDELDEVRDERVGSGSGSGAVSAATSSVPAS